MISCDVYKSIGGQMEGQICFTTTEAAQDSVDYFNRFRLLTGRGLRVDEAEVLVSFVD